MLSCTKPDHDVSGLVCGYPLPCPWHTVIIDTAPTPPTVTFPLSSDAPPPTPKLRQALREIAEAVRGLGECDHD